MKMDRNINANGKGKYALVLMRNYPFEASMKRAEVDRAMQTLADNNMLDHGEAGSPSEFFLIRLKDRFAQAALHAYAVAASAFDVEWAAEVERIAGRSGPASPHCKAPD